MLSEIRIDRFLYLEDINLELSKGLNVFTGETGVGKSLIIDAISYVFGDKGKYADGSFVELVFENVENPYCEDGVLILARGVKNGKNLYYINGKRATLSTLKEASKNLIAIHGQNQQERLFDKKYHINILDDYCKNRDILEEYNRLFARYRQLEKEEELLTAQQSNRLKELDILKFQLQELEEAGIKEGEKQSLEERYTYLTNISSIKETVLGSLYILQEKEESISQELSTVIKELSKISDFSGDIQNILQLLEEAKAVLDEASFSLEKIDVDYDPQELTQIEERLNLLNRLELKYNTDEKGLLELIKQFRERIDYLENLQLELPKIREEKEKVFKKLSDLAQELSNARKKCAQKMQSEIEKHLKELAMKEARFVIDIKETHLGKIGKDQVIFLFSANKGFEPMPVDEVASGGEISRLSLSVKLVAGSDVDCMVFDEVDTGVGGKTAIFMAQKLKKLSEKYQVILITHLPQIAVYGDRHFYVDKFYSENKTHAIIKQLQHEERIKEIARMLSGKINQQTIRLAKQLLEEAS